MGHTVSINVLEDVVRIKKISGRAASDEDGRAIKSLEKLQEKMIRGEMVLPHPSKLVTSEGVVEGDRGLAFTR